MSFREKSTWVMFTALMMTLLAYGLSAAGHGFEEGSVRGILVAVVGFVVLAAIGHVVVGATSGKDADLSDERDLDVDRRTDRLGDGALSAVIIGIAAYGMIQGDWLVAHMAFFGLFGAAALKSGAMIVLYRLSA